MKNLKELTVVCVDCYNYGKAILAIEKCKEQINPSEFIFFTDKEIEIPGVKTIKIPTISSKEEYSFFCLKKMAAYIETTHCLVIQWDGYVLDAEVWKEEFLNYDYIGAPWLYYDGRNVGNGGFSLRSKKLLDVLSSDSNIVSLHPEDDAIARTYRPYLEGRYNIKFAPEELADSFSYELRVPNQKTFGFHGFFNYPYRPYVVIKRSGAIGDIILAEPVMRHFNNAGYNVVLDIPIQFFDLFNNHCFPITHISNFDLDRIQPEKYINLDFSYESRPNQNRLKSYFEFSDVKDYKLSKPQLFPLVNEKTKLFEKYAVLHIDNKSMPHRNVFGVNWDAVKKNLEALGYTVFQVGKEEHEKIGIEINTTSTGFLKFVIAGCDLFIGIDSGPLNIAMAYNKKCIGFFGSVNPEYVYNDLSNLEVIQQPCVYQHCYHSAPSTTGFACKFDVEKPPCCISDTMQVINAINKLNS